MMLKKLNKKHILSVAFVAASSLLIAANASAAVAGPYVGGQIGFGNVHQDGFSTSQLNRAIGGTFVSGTNSSKDTGVAGRVFAGYQMNQNFAAEMGYSKFTNATANASVNTQAPTQTLTAKGTVKTYAVDLVGKAILPLQYGFNLYGKAGIAYLNSSTEVSTTLVKKGFGTTTTSAKVTDTAHHIYPTFGAGVGYDVTQNLVADVSWNRIQKTGNSSKLASTDLFAVGMAYNFG